jgi:flagellar basal-body rod modification protein FlgD
MEIQETMSQQEQLRVQSQVNSFNKALTEGGRTAQQDLGKDDFLKILMTQLQNQDPTKPMEDKQFIAQMAQFSTLEQMNNMSENFAQLNAKLQSSQAMNMLGKSVEVTGQGDQTINGTVAEVTMGEHPQVLVNGTYYDFSQVKRITE